MTDQPNSAEVSEERCPHCGAPGPLTRTWGDAHSAGTVRHFCNPYRFMPERESDA